MTSTERRLRFRRILAGDRCVRPATVWDPVSARIAQALGFEIGMLAGSVASAVAVGAPDNAVITLTEFAETAHRVTRAADLSLMVDADHGYGNALNVMRTVRELEDAGVAAMTIEDTLLPRPYGRKGPGEGLVTPEEMRGKLRASLAARQDTAMVIIGRTSALRTEGLTGAVTRVRAYAEEGVDAVFLTDVTTLDQLRAVREAIGAKPIALGTTPDALSFGALAALGVRVALRGHQPFQAAVKAVYDALKHQADGREPSALRERLASAEVMNIATGTAEYERWQQEFLG